MNRNDLEWAARLADTGFRIWISPSDVSFRGGDRLTKEKAENLASILDMFDRKIVKSLFIEGDVETDPRFLAYENRIKDILFAFG
jgi:hypothetical protein